MSYLKQGPGTRVTPQREPIPGRTDQAENSAGGYVFKLNPMARLRRFLILGAQGGTFYIGERKLIRENQDALRLALQEAGTGAVDLIVEVSERGLAPRNDEALFALAVAAGTDQPDEVQEYALRALPRVARTGTHLFMFLEFALMFRGFGTRLRKAVAAWYESDDVDRVAYQVVKYRQRGNWTHKGALMMAHPVPPSAAHEDLFAWVTDSVSQDHYWRFMERDEVRVPAVVEAFVQAQASDSPARTAKLVRESSVNLPREALLTEHLRDPDVNRALLERGMPMTALIRNLGNLTRYGILKPLDELTNLVCSQITSVERLRKARVHPMQVLFALATYRHGHGFRSANRWDPVQKVCDALVEAFYMSFEAVEPTGKKHVLGLDVSGSMSSRFIRDSTVSCMAAATAMSMVALRTEPESVAMMFDTGFKPAPISASTRLDDALRALPQNMGGTDCSLPMLWARHHKIEVDVFAVYTDNETWAGSMHPMQALELYRQEMGRDAKLIVVGMVSNGFSIADPSDPGMLDCVGFDASAPAVMASFVRGEV